jgi:hypothetical protein
MNNNITELVLQKRSTIPKKKIEMTEDNLVIKKDLTKKIKEKTKKTKKSKKCLSESDDSSDDSDIEV